MAPDIHVIYFPAHVNLVQDVKARLKATSVPIVTAHRQLPKELNITDQESATIIGSYVYVLELTATYPDGTSELTEVVTHYITEPFGPGYLRVCNWEGLTFLYGTMGTGLQVLADRTGWFNSPALAVMVAGALDKDKEPVPGRRVVLPWGTDSFNFAELTPDGLTVLKRSLDWGAAAWTGMLPGVASWDEVEIEDSGYIDGYDSRIGLYGGANVNANAAVATNAVLDRKIKVLGGQLRGSAHIPPDADLDRVVEVIDGGIITGDILHLPALVPMPFAAEPAGMGAAVDCVYSSGTITISSDLHANGFTITNNATVLISGTVTILCSGEVDIRGTGRLVLDDGARLTMYTKDEVDIQDTAKVNPGVADPSRLTWIVLGDRIRIKGDAQLTAAVQASAGEVSVQDRAHFYGTFIGKKFKVEHTGAAHIDTGRSGTVATMGSATPLARITGKRVRWVEAP